MRNAYYARAFADLGMGCGNLAIARDILKVLHKFLHNVGFRSEADVAKWYTQRT